MIIISTKLKTTNIGNQALSDELIYLSSQLYKDKKKYVITGRPTGLDKYTIRDLDPNNLIKSFEDLSQKILTYSSNLPPNVSAFKRSKPRTHLLDVKGTIVKTESLRRIYRKLRKFIRSFNIYSGDYKNRLELYKGSEMYLYSAAGEISEEDFFYRQLLDLRVAQLMGLKVCAINQSVELPEGPYKTLLGYVYSNMFKIVVRGDISKADLIKLGVKNAIISVTPDTAFLTNVLRNKKQKTIKRIGINFTKKTYKEEQIDPFIQSLINAGYSLTFITNDPFGDEEIGKEFHTKFEIPIDLDTRDYKNFTSDLQKYDAIISSRLHTNEMALVAGVPILPVEGNLHKTTEVFKRINYPIEAINYTSNNYRDNLNNGFRTLVDSYPEINNWIEVKMPLVAQEACHNLTFSNE